MQLTIEAVVHLVLRSCTACTPSGSRRSKFVTWCGHALAVSCQECAWTCRAAVLCLLSCPLFQLLLLKPSDARLPAKIPDHLSCAGRLICSCFHVLEATPAAPDLVHCLMRRGHDLHRTISLWVAIIINLLERKAGTH